MSLKGTQKPKTRTWQDVSSEPKEHRDATLRQVIGDEDMNSLNLIKVVGSSVVDLPAEMKHFLQDPALQITNAKLEILPISSPENSCQPRK